MGKSKSVLVSREQMDILEAAVNRITKMQMPQGWFIAHADELTTDYDWIPSQAAYLMKNIPVEPAAQSRPYCNQRPNPQHHYPSIQD